MGRIYLSVPKHAAFEAWEWISYLLLHLSGTWLLIHAWTSVNPW